MTRVPVAQLMGQLSSEKVCQCVGNDTIIDNYRHHRSMVVLDAFSISVPNSLQFPVEFLQYPFCAFAVILHLRQFRVVSLQDVVSQVF